MYENGLKSLAIFFAPQTPGPPGKLLNYFVTFCFRTLKIPRAQKTLQAPPHCAVTLASNPYKRPSTIMHPCSHIYMHILERESITVRIYYNTK